MSGIDLLFRTAIDYERTHQVALYTLLTESNFSNLLVGIPDPTSIEWEPERQLFDLGVIKEVNHAYIEIKMWSNLGDNQLTKQQAFLSLGEYQGFYILLGTSWFEYSHERIEEKYSNSSKKIGYDELIDGLKKLLSSTGISADVHELALAYRNALQYQYDKLINAAHKSSSKDKIYYYSLFYLLQQKVSSLDTAIYTEINPGGPAYILNNQQDWLEVIIDGVGVKLYYEVVNDKLCIKFYPNTTDIKLKYSIRDKIRKAIHSVIGSKYKIRNAGRLGKYMTACQIEHDFTDISVLDESAGIFKDLHNHFPDIIKAI